MLLAALINSWAPCGKPAGTGLCGVVGRLIHRLAHRNWG